MFKLELTLVLHFVPPMNEHGHGIRLTRTFELPFPPTENLNLVGKPFGEDREGFRIKEVTWDVDRQQYFANTYLTDHDCPIASIPGEIEMWVERGWELATASIFEETAEELEVDDQVETAVAGGDEIDEWDEAETLATRSPRKRPAEFNKLLRAIVREMAVLYNNLSTAYAIDQTKMFFSDEQLKEKTPAKERFENARWEFEKMSQDAQSAWQERVMARYPKLDKIVRGSS